jgi:hypothetical protein
MENITSISELKNAIQILENEQAVKMQSLKEQFYLTYKSLKPANLLLSTFKEVVTSPNLIDNILGTVVGLATGYLSKKIVVGASGNILRKLFGSVLQLSVTNTVSQHPDAIKSIGQFIIQNFFRKKEVKTF